MGRLTQWTSLLQEAMKIDRDVSIRTGRFFEDVAAEHDLVNVFATLRDSADTAYVVSSDGRLLSHNAAWERFALDNRGERVLTEWQVGCSILDAIAAPLERSTPTGSLGRVRNRRAGITTTSATPTTSIEGSACPHIRSDSSW